MMSKLPRLSLPSIAKSAALLVENISARNPTKQVFHTTRFKSFVSASLKYLRTKVTPDLHPTYIKNGGKSGVGIKMLKSDNFQYFSIKS